MKKIFFTFFSTVFTCFSLQPLYAQQQQFDQIEQVAEPENEEVKMPDDQGNYLDLKSGWFLGGDIGTSLLYGDVTTYNVFPDFSNFNKIFGSGVSILGGKKIKWGLSGEIQLSSLKTKGYKTSIPNNPFYFNGDYRSYSVSAKYNLSDFYMRNMGKRISGKIPNRLQTYFSVGIGQVFFRSRLYYAADKRLKKTYGYKESAQGQITGQQLLEKDKALRSLIVPLSFKFQYRLNFQTDVLFDFYYVNAFSDKLDGWDRNWTAQDRYMYVGVGLVRNFGRTADDELPNSMRYLPQEKKKKNEDMADNIIVTDDTKRGWFRRKKRSTNVSDDELNLRLKMLDTQLKLFEIQQKIEEKK